MLLKKVIIENYRSIDHLEIDINEVAGSRFHTLFGINETGKSNILKAIALLTPDNSLLPEEQVQYNRDCNKNAIKMGKPIVLRYIFNITKEDELFEKIKTSNIELKSPGPIISPNRNSKKCQYYIVEKIIEYDEKSLRKEGYLIRRTDALNKIIDREGFKKDPDFITEKLIVTNADDITNIDSKNIQKHINSQAKQILDELLPNIIYWKYSDEYLITKPIDLNQFAKNLNNSVPLKHIFQLCNYKDDLIISNIKRIQSNFDIRKEFEEELSATITKHINRIWPQHPINIGIRIEGSNLCYIYVEDKGTLNQSFTMDQRSDGFKQFISILLSLSVRNITNDLTNNVILLDEPEISLHPGSIKCLRDELLNIAKNNIVFASSHSIFMVDKENLGRHYTVTKENSYTNIEAVDPKNPYQDEVVYNALGTSIFEIISRRMLIFEGRTDKDIFDAFTIKFKEHLEPVDIQTISATGSNQIPKYTKFFHNKLVSGFAVVDSDPDGRHARKEIEKSDEEFADCIFEINDLIEVDENDRTLEDILPKTLVLSCANDQYEANFDIEEDKPILKSIKEVKVKEQIHTDGKFEELKKSIVQTVINDVQHKSIAELEEEYPLYVQFLTNLHSKIKEVSNNA